MMAFTEAREHSMLRSKPVRDFLMAHRTKEPTFADVRLVVLTYKALDNLYEFIVEDFRQHTHLRPLHDSNGGETRSAFASNLTNFSSSNTSATFQGQQTPLELCICDICIGLQLVHTWYGRKKLRYGIRVKLSRTVSKRSQRTIVLSHEVKIAGRQRTLTL